MCTRLGPRFDRTFADLADRWPQAMCTSLGARVDQMSVASLGPQCSGLGGVPVLVLVLRHEHQRVLLQVPHRVVDQLQKKTNTKDQA